MKKKEKNNDNTNRKDDMISTTPPSSAAAASAAGVPRNELLEALALRPTVSPLLHDALGRTRDEICHGDGTDACPGIHEVNNLIFTTMTKKQKADFLERLRMGVIIRRRILDEDIRETLWKGLEDPKHITTIKHYEKKLDRWARRKNKKYKPGKQDKVKVQAMVSKHMKEIAEADHIDSSGKDSASEYGNLDSNNEVNLDSHATMRRSGRRFVGDFSNLTHEARAAMTDLHATLDRLRDAWEGQHRRMSKLRSAADLPNKYVEYQKLQRLLSNFRLQFNAQAERVMECAECVPSGEQRKRTHGAAYSVGVEIQIHMAAMSRLRSLLKPTQQAGPIGRQTVKSGYRGRSGMFRQPQKRNREDTDDFDWEKFVSDHEQAEKMSWSTVGSAGGSSSARNTLPSHSTAELLQLAVQENLDAPLKRMNKAQRKNVENAVATIRNGAATLYLNESTIGDMGAAKLADALPDSNLTSISLIDAQIGDAGAIHMAKMLPQSGLTSLDLSLNFIGDQGTFLSFHLCSVCLRGLKLFELRNDDGILPLIFHTYVFHPTPTHPPARATQTHTHTSLFPLRPHRRPFLQLTNDGENHLILLDRHCCARRVDPNVQDVDIARPE